MFTTHYNVVVGRDEDIVFINFHTEQPASLRGYTQTQFHEQT